MSQPWPLVPFREFLRPHTRPYELGAHEDANLVGMRLYGGGPFHRELKPALRIAKKSHFVIRSGDIIYNKLFAWKGAFGVVPPSLDGMFVSDKFPTYELDRAKVDERYLAWYFRIPELWQQAEAMSAGSAALSKLTLNPPKFLLLEIPLPPLVEQQRLAARIDELAAKVSEARALHRYSTEAAAALSKAYLTKLLGGRGATGTLSEVLEGKPRNGWSAKCDNRAEGIPVLSLAAVTGFQYRKDAFKRTTEPTSENAHYWLESGDLLITRSNTPDLVGHAAIYDGDPTPCIYPDLMMKLVVNERRAITRFVWLWLQTTTARDYVRLHAKGTSSTMKKISQPIVMSIPFPTAITLREQQQLLEQFKTVEATLAFAKNTQAQAAAEVDSLLAAILDRAFKGKL